MKLAWLSEGGYTGKVPREQTANAGVLWAWMSNLEVDHYPILNFEHAPTDGYDYLILQILYSLQYTEGLLLVSIQAMRIRCIFLLQKQIIMVNIQMSFLMAIVALHSGNMMPMIVHGLICH